MLDIDGIQAIYGHMWQIQRLLILFIRSKETQLLSFSQQAGVYYYFQPSINCCVVHDELHLSPAWHNLSVDARIKKIFLIFY